MKSDSQLHQHLRYGWRHWLRQFRQKFRLGSLGAHVNIDKNVEFLRFPNNIHVGDSVVFKEGARICSCNKNAKISIGARTTVGYNTFVFSSGSIVIGEDCLIAPFVYLVDSNHNYQRGQLINEQGNSVDPIVIGRDVWIGAKASILAGVTIGDGAIVATGATVNRDVEPYTIVGGTPARYLGERK